MERHELTEVGDHVLLRQLGAGGFGEVWEARSKVNAALTAIKLIERSEKSMSDMLFARESYFLHQLAIHDPGKIVPAPQFKQVGEHKIGKVTIDFLVQEYLPGHDLGHRLNQLDGRCARLALEYFRDTFDALEVVHSCGLIHCDIKPENIRVLPGGQVKLLDFGLAINTRDSHGAGLGFGGTLKYAAPEQSERSRCSETIDVFALGVIMYQELLGKHPFVEEIEKRADVKNYIQYLAAVRVLARDLQVEISGSPQHRLLAELIKKCLNPDPKARPSASEAKDVLSSLTRENGQFQLKRQRHSEIATKILGQTLLTIRNNPKFNSLEREVTFRAIPLQDVTPERPAPIPVGIVSPPVQAPIPLPDPEPPIPQPPIPQPTIPDPPAPWQFRTSIPFGVLAALLVLIFAAILTRTDHPPPEPNTHSEEAHFLLAGSTFVVDHSKDPGEIMIRGQLKAADGGNFSCRLQRTPRWALTDLPKRLDCSDGSLEYEDRVEKPGEYSYELTVTNGKGQTEIRRAGVRVEQ